VSGLEALPLTERLLGEIRAEFPHFQIVSKAGNAFSRAIDLSLKCITFGGQSRYMTHYHTVIGSTLYVCDAWTRMSDEARVILLRHERVHLRQRRRYGFVPFAFLYLVPLLPLGLAYGRARLEWEAYRETLRATAELRGLSALRDAALRDEIVRRFTGPDYGWMWPFRNRVEKWFDEAVAELRAEAAPRTHPSSEPTTGPLA
jgi:hypothetical protein